MTHICINSACKVSTSCVHSIVYNKVDSEQKYINIINPKSIIFDEDGCCQHFRRPQKVLYGYGFMNEMRKMTHEQYRAFTHDLIALYNRTDFYAMRNGSRPIPPDRQKMIIAVAAKIGYDFGPTAWDHCEEVEE